MKNYYIAIALVGFLYVSGHVRKGLQVALKYFSASEFGVWWPMMSVDLLQRLDKFRERIGRPVMISTAVGAIGRVGVGTSRHNVTKWGEVQAVDVMFVGATIDELKDYYDVAREIFGGVGVYPDWSPAVGMHLDVRPETATWAGVDVDGTQEYFAVERAWA